MHTRGKLPTMTKCQSYNYLLVILMSILVIITMGLTACSPALPTPTSTPTPVPMPTPEFTNSGSNSKVAELEAEIRQLKAENQRLLSENHQLSRDLSKLTTQLQGIQSLVASSSYRQTLSKLPNIQTDATELATFMQGLPDLPPLPPGLTVSQIDDAVNTARNLRWLLQSLPPPPPFLAPSFWVELDNMKEEFIRMTEWMEDLEDLPQILRVAGDFDDLRADMIACLRDVATTVSSTRSMLEEVRNTASSQ